MNTHTNLTPRETQCVVMVAQSAPRKAIASALSVSKKCVDFHLAKAGRKIGSGDVASFTRFAIRMGWVAACAVMVVLTGCTVTTNRQQISSRLVDMPPVPPSLPTVQRQADAVTVVRTQRVFTVPIKWPSNMPPVCAWGVVDADGREVPSTYANGDLWVTNPPAVILRAYGRKLSGQ